MTFLGLYLGGVAPFDSRARAVHYDNKTFSLVGAQGEIHSVDCTCARQFFCGS